MTNDHDRAWGAAALTILVLAGAICAAPLCGHSDEIDPHMYGVLARHMAESRRWLDPSYLPSIFYRFREHLPFGVWPLALAELVFGERAVVPLALLFSLGTLTVILFAAAPIVGRVAALAAVLVLASTESFFRYAGQPRLDHLLLLLTTASALPLWRPSPVPAARWAVSAALTAMAVLVKGPFGLLPLVASTVARSVALRSAREMLPGCLAAAAAILPAAAFLGHDALLGQGTWWRGYVVDQLFASASGLRTDGERGLVPLKSIAGRFWPGLPLSLWGIGLGLRDLVRRRTTALSILTVHTLVALGFLCLPSRKIWHHTWVIYPALAILAGIAAAPSIQRLVHSEQRLRAALVALVALAAGATVASLAGAGAILTPGVCVIPRRLGASVPTGADVMVVAPVTDWKAMAALAAEYRLNPWPTRLLSGDVPLEASPPGSGPAGPERRATFALLRADVLPGPHRGWHERAGEGDWTLWVRDPGPPR
ncbi:MAG: hypothetical protein NVS4B10_05310 [Myxococcales bacterium]